MPRNGTAWGCSAATGLTLGLTIVMTGCIPSEKPGFDAASPSRRLDAIVQASDPQADAVSLARLVEQLESQDAAARMLAIRALERRTGETLGYTHTDPKWKRQESINRWLIYLDSGGSDSDLVLPAGEQDDGDPMDS